MLFQRKCAAAQLDSELRFHLDQQIRENIAAGKVLRLVLGLAASAGLTQLIESMLYGTQPLDPAIFFSVSLLLLVAAVACAAPAWQASRLNPVQALRSE